MLLPTREDKWRLTWPQSACVCVCDCVCVCLGFAGLLSRCWPSHAVYKAGTWTPRKPRRQSFVRYGYKDTECKNFCGCLPKNRRVLGKISSTEKHADEEDDEEEEGWRGEKKHCYLGFSLFLWHYLYFYICLRHKRNNRQLLFGLLIEACRFLYVDIVEMKPEAEQRSVILSQNWMLWQKVEREPSEAFNRSFWRNPIQLFWRNVQFEREFKVLYCRFHIRCSHTPSRYILLYN